MRVCIPIEFRPHGGGYYFLNMFSQYLESHGHQVVSRIDGTYEILFTNHWMVSRQEILKSFRHNVDVRIVQRIDGAAQDYGRDEDADIRQRAVNTLTDLTIFQSQYCRYSTREKFSVILHDGPVIPNPVHVDQFTPKGLTRDFKHSPLLVSVSWSNNPLKGAQSIYSVAQQNPEMGFVLCGPFPDAPDLPNLYRLGVVAHDDLPTILRSCDLLLTFSKNEACPNHVLEALASGLPALYDDSGAMAEVIGDCGLPVTINNFPAQAASLLQAKNAYSRKARKRALELFSPDVIFPQYLAQLNGVLDRPTRISKRKRRLLGLLSTFQVRLPKG